MALIKFRHLTISLLIKTSNIMKSTFSQVCPNWCLYACEVNLEDLLVLVLDHLWVLLPDVLMVVASEVAVDIIKHAFITKFNDITADVSTRRKRWQREDQWSRTTKVKLKSYFNISRKIQIVCIEEDYLGTCILIKDHCAENIVTGCLTHSSPLFDVCRCTVNTKLAWPLSSSAADSRMWVTTW